MRKQIEHLSQDAAAQRALRGPVRLRTLTTLRWLAVGGQSAGDRAGALLGSAIPTPLGLCLAGDRRQRLG